MRIREAEQDVENYLCFKIGMMAMQAIIPSVWGVQ